MADNTLLNQGLGGDTVRDVDNNNYTQTTPINAKTQVIKPDFGGQAGEQLVTTTNPFPSAKTGSYFVVSTANSSTTQLAAGASFTGTIEALPAALEASLNIASDKPFTVVVNYYAGSSANTWCGSQSFSSYFNYKNTTGNGYGLNVALTENGSYLNLVLTNTGLATTTQLNISTEYGDIPAIDQAGNTPTAIYGTGDLAGINLIEENIKGSLPFNMVVNNPELRDINQALIISDCPAAQRLLSSTVGQTFIIDTQGYPSVAITMGTMAATLTGVNDLAGTWVSIPAMSVNGAVATTSSLAAATTYIIPSVTRYMKLVTTLGWATYQLRTVQSSINNMAQAPMNIVNIGGSASLGAGYIVLGASASTNGQTLGSIIVSSTTPAATVIKASAGRLTQLDLFNGSSAVAFFHVYNATSVTLGTTAAIQVYGVQAGTGRTVILPDGGLYFSTGIAGAWTNLVAATDNTALTAAGQSTNYAYI